MPWFPFQGIVHYWRLYFRPQPNSYEEQQGILVYFPHFYQFTPYLNLVMVFYGTGLFIYADKTSKKFNIIEVYFTYPDSYDVAGEIAKNPRHGYLAWHGSTFIKNAWLKIRLLMTLKSVICIFSVSNSLKQHMVSLSAKADKIPVMGNRIDLFIFYPLTKSAARTELKL